jgi:hypothetical protein
MAGRPKGSKTRYSATLQRQMLRSDNLTPLDYLVSVYTDDSNSLRDRLDAAKAAAPYVHPRLSAVVVSNDSSYDDIRCVPTAELLAIINGESGEGSCGSLPDSHLQIRGSGDPPTPVGDILF